MTSPEMCTPLTSTSFSAQRRGIAVVTVFLSALLLITVCHPTGFTESTPKIQGYNMTNSVYYAIDNVLSLPHRKLLSPKRSVHKPARFWGDTTECTDSDIVISQGPGAPLPSGIPTYTVQISNACATGCDISDIHIHCGWFSSARLINPQIFKRLSYNDCLVNGGLPLRNGQSISFQYANTYSYPLGISAMSCL